MRIFLSLRPFALHPLLAPGTHTGRASLYDLLVIFPRIARAQRFNLALFIILANPSPTTANRRFTDDRELPGDDAHAMRTTAPTRGMTRLPQVRAVPLIIFRNPWTCTARDLAPFLSLDRGDRGMTGSAKLRPFSIDFEIGVNCPRGRNGAELCVLVYENISGN